jgi:hypothetical protein
MAVSVGLVEGMLAFLTGSTILEEELRIAGIEFLAKTEVEVVFVVVDEGKIEGPACRVLNSKPMSVE